MSANPQSAVPVWSCEFSPLAESGAAALNALTVGSRFRWKCHGDLAVDWDTKTVPALVFAKPEQQFSLAILKVIQQQPNAVEFEVTAYKPGAHTPEYVRVLQGQGSPTEIGFEAVKPAWTVQSVLDPKQPSQPYGSFGPWSLSLPVWFWLTILLVVLVVAYAVIRRTRRYLQRRRMLEELARHKTALKPLHQFYKDARQLRRRLYDFKEQSDLGAISTELNKEFRLYVLRQFQIPTLDWSNAEIIKELKRRHRSTFHVAGDPLKQVLRELGKLKTRTNLSSQDVEQLLRMSLDTAERLEVTGGKG